MEVKSRSVKRNAKNARGLIFPAATAPFPKSRASYSRFARFNTALLYYLRAWHRLGHPEKGGFYPFSGKRRKKKTKQNKTEKVATPYGSANVLSVLIQ